jgi:MazG family protein
VISFTIFNLTSLCDFAKINRNVYQSLRNHSLSKISTNIDNLREIMAALRDPETGCPWDLAQDFASIVPHTLEEAYEVAETIETGDMGELQDELGDLLFQVIFYSRLAEERDLFDFDAVASSIADKLVRRHPHVFDKQAGDAKVSDAESQTEAWEAGKARERAEKEGAVSALDGVATALPALTRAVKLQKRAARVGFDWPEITPVFAKVEEELAEVQDEVAEGGPQARIEEEIGDLLFACTNLARLARVEPERALRHANRKFERRFAHMERMAREQKCEVSDLGLKAWDALWEQVKASERKGDSE